MAITEQGQNSPTTAREAEIVAAVHEGLRRRGSDLPLRLWDGTPLGPRDARFRIALREPSSLRSMLVPPREVVIGEAFVHGVFDVEGSMLEALRAVVALRHNSRALRFLTEVTPRLLRLPKPDRAGPLRAARLHGRRHSRRRDRGAVRFHYDVGNDFYALFLDRELVYSCAYFATEHDSIHQAQQRKLELICRKLHLSPGERLLDIGCGWGALVIHAARRHGVHALGVTLSEAQAELARRRVAEAGLADRVEIRVQDYRDVDGAFDAVASIGMFEHVGPERFGQYFAHAHRLTAPGGRFLNHAITTGRRREIRDLSRAGDSFVGRHVFPDGALAPASEAVRLMEDAGFELVDVEQLRPHYARTLTHWSSRLEARADEARRLVGEEIYRVWRAYLAGSVLGFESGDLGVVQVLGGKDAALPYGRAWMIP